MKKIFENPLQQAFEFFNQPCEDKSVSLLSKRIDNVICLSDYLDKSNNPSDESLKNFDPNSAEITEKIRRRASYLKW
ncbi:hypothetical protein [Chromobacterium phragmitis]|uniref:hypothetical protein n=1 Tax=Chromobacterium phragmitis TaxID=2202141 RepID=UPI0011AE5B9A|nr:hypothetical protein [Chromobacterium phragmitis]